MENVNNYLELIQAPWGRMFYELLFHQLDLPQTPRLKILDFGSGLGVTASHFAAWHDVTAVDPDAEMIKHRRKENIYTQIHGTVESLAAFQANTFDAVLCHNVLDYVEDKEPIVAELFRVLKPGGPLSIIKHNRAGKVFQTAVFQNDPQKALSLLDSRVYDKSNYLGTQYIYTNDDVAVWAAKYGGKIRNILGMRTFWALGQDNAVKYTDGWYQNMLALEMRAAELNAYRQVAMFNHLLISKK